MKTRPTLLFAAMLILTALTAIAQDARQIHPASKQIIPFGQKLPAPDLTNTRSRLLQRMPVRGVSNRVGNDFLQNIKSLNSKDFKKDPQALKQQLLEKRNSFISTMQNRNTATAAGLGSNSTPDLDFYLTKDINTLSESFPNNGSYFDVHPSYAVSDGVIYFAADDGIHGYELWRTDGTETGTYMVKDVEPGNGSSSAFNITVLNGKLYFSAFTSDYGYEPWVSDGTEKGTHLLKDIKPGIESSYPTEFVSLGNTIYFVADGDFSFWDALWSTDGTTKGTTIIKNFGSDFSGYYITQLTAANNLLFFTFLDAQNGLWELWRSDGSSNNTYHIGTKVTFADIPAQLTSYNNQLYFSADDGNGRRLWVSDGTDAGTTVAPKNHDVEIYADYINVPFPILNNVLYIPSISIFTYVGALYKYDASNNRGLVKVSDLTTLTNPISVFIIPSEMTVVNNVLYFKVTNYNGGQHDELWSSKGNTNSTQSDQKFSSGESIYYLFNGGGNLFFIRSTKATGTELWTGLHTPIGTILHLVSDIFKGQASSYPYYLTAFRGKLFFNATDDKKGNELFMTDCNSYSTSLVKDINKITTSSSFAAFFNDIYDQWIAPLGKDVLFDAFENVHGFELYRSDGTAKGTNFLNDVQPGESSSQPNHLSSKNNKAYFIAYSSDTTFALYRSDGTPSGLQRMTPNLPYSYYLLNFDVADNGLVYYVMYNYYTAKYELWRTDGTHRGTILLSYTVYYINSLHIIGNTAFFVAGDPQHGYELWKSNGTFANTRMVKDINPGNADAAPGGLFVYNNEVYIDAFDGLNYSLWKSDGTASGTVKLKNIDFWWSGSPISNSRYFCVSNNVLYFSALDYSNGKGTQLWRTDGTPAGTKAVKDINPYDSSVTPGPYYLTGVNGTLFFLADDGVHGYELWKTDGTNKGTELVKDITAGVDGSYYLDNLVSYAGKLFFNYNGILWSSDGTNAGTEPVNNEVINNLVSINSITSTGSMLYIAGNSLQYGYELYVGEANDKGVITMSGIANAKAITTTSFDATLSPNPAVANTRLQIKGGTQNVSVSIRDINGKTLWQSSNINTMFIDLPSQPLAAGTYFITVTNGKESKTLKLVKQ